MDGTQLKSSYSVSVSLRATSSGKASRRCKALSSSGKEGGRASIRRGKAEAAVAIAMAVDVDAEDEELPLDDELPLPLPAPTDSEIVEPPPPLPPGERSVCSV